MKPWMETISESELERIGMLEAPENAKELYEIDESLLYKKPKKEKLELKSKSNLSNDSYFKTNVGATQGASNCWAVHGKHTESGKPILSCDPHLLKATYSLWYLTRLSWTETDS